MSAGSRSYSSRPNNGIEHQCDVDTPTIGRVMYINNLNDVGKTTISSNYKYQIFVGALSSDNRKKKHVSFNYLSGTY